jgi:hypothetical protein
MRVRVADGAALQSVPSRNLRIYLASRGWERREVQGQATVWTFGEGAEQYEVVPPSTDSVPDFANRLAEILRALAALEDRSELDILRELSQVRYDVQHYRTNYDGPEGTAPLGDAAAAMKAAQSMLVAAATSLALPGRAVLPSRSPAEAFALGKRALTGPTSEGSFLLSVWVPVPPRLTAEEDLVLFDATGEPYERAVTRRLHESMVALEEAVKDAQNIDAGIAAFVDRVDRGVNANLCEGVAAALGESRAGLETRFSWALDRPVRVENPVVHFEPSDQVVLQEAAREMRELVPEEEVLVQGNVVRLHRDSEQGAGDMTVAGILVGDVDDRLRKVTVGLAAQDYEIAIRAHREFEQVEVVGELYRRGTRTYLRNPRNFSARPVSE